MARRRFEAYGGWMFLIFVMVLLSMMLAALPTVLKMRKGVSDEDRAKAYAPRSR